MKKWEEQKKVTKHKTITILSILQRFIIHIKNYCETHTVLPLNKPINLYTNFDNLKIENNAITILSSANIAVIILNNFQTKVKFFYSFN